MSAVLQLMAFLLAVPAPNAGAPPITEVEHTVVSSESTSALSQFVTAHLPLTDRFEAERQTWIAVPNDLITTDFHIARFPKDDERVTIAQLNDALLGCVPSNRMDANSVSMTFHYDCRNRQRARLVYNFGDGRISRVLVGDIPQKLRCIDGLCIDKAEK